MMAPNFEVYQRTNRNGGHGLAVTFRPPRVPTGARVIGLSADADRALGHPARVEYLLNEDHDTLAIRATTETHGDTYKVSRAGRSNQAHVPATHLLRYLEVGPETTRYPAEMADGMLVVDLSAGTRLA